ncbi:hypothetical protein Hanom_Chr11g00998641 [Helianthus anomalus]
MAWSPDPFSDSHSVEENLVDSSSEESDDVSVAGGDEENSNMVDEVEEGEIRSPILRSPVSEGTNRPPSEPPPEPANDRSPLIEKLGPERSRDMVGGIEEPVDDELHGVHGESHGHNSENVAADFLEDGPHLKGVNNNYSVDHLFQEGPTPLTGLRKRNRADRSPPSSGSQQGPPSKSFYQDPSPEDFSFDLNRPSPTSGAVFGEQPLS